MAMVFIRCRVSVDKKEIEFKSLERRKTGSRKSGSWFEFFEGDDKSPARDEKF